MAQSTNNSVTSKPEILVILSLRGGCDGLNLIGPSADPVYIGERKSELRVERTGDKQGLLLANSLADVDFRFHFKAPKLKSLYDAGHLAIVQACGLTNGTRSHFEAIDYIERGTPDNKNTPSGWLTRLIESQKLTGFVPIVSASNSLPVALLACSEALAISSVKKMQLQSSPQYLMLKEAALRKAYQGNGSIIRNGIGTLGIIDIFASKTIRDAQGKIQDYTPSHTAEYPTEWYTNEISNSLKTVAQLVKMDVGVQIATVDHGGWDTHINQNYSFTNLVDGLSRALGAFWEDMVEYQERLTVVVMSEFGRRLRSNESNGTDHGHGNMMMVLGGKVKGGTMYGKWPGLANEHLDNGVDLAVTTDYRTVLSEVITTRLRSSSLDTIFPKFIYKPLGFLNA